MRALLRLVLAAALLGPGASAAAGAVDVPWTDYLPALSPAVKPQPGPVPGCRRASLGCIRGEITKMRSLQRRLGCDHRAVFATTYLELTRKLYATMRTDRRFFRHPDYLEREDALFADVYFRTFARAARGQAVPPAWQLAFASARRTDLNAGQDMLLGINAHVQNDMPFVVAALGLRTRGGASRKPDHDRFNQILTAAYEPVIEAIQRRYDPIVSLISTRWSPLGQIAGMQLVRAWREEVWRNAEGLVDARTKAQRAQVAERIKANAAATARLIAAPAVPGYAATRDAYCAAHAG